MELDYAVNMNGDAEESTFPPLQTENVSSIYMSWIASKFDLFT